jgi:hypothetical protein
MTPEFISINELSSASLFVLSSRVGVNSVQIGCERSLSLIWKGEKMIQHMKQ